jgi:hypothetical protein
MAVVEPSHNLSRIICIPTQTFITLVDALKLGERAVDSLHPYLKDLVSSMNKLSTLPSDFEGKLKVKEWCVQRCVPAWCLSVENTDALLQYHVKERDLSTVVLECNTTKGGGNL